MLKILSFIQNLLMKARLFLFVFAIFSLTSTRAQMRVQQDGNTATFVVDDNIDVSNLS